MKDALWSVDLVGGNKESGAGVVVFENGRVFGGDSQYFYLGTYRISGNFITGDLEVTHFDGPAHPAFGSAARFSLIISGPVDDAVMELQADVVGSKSKQLRIRLTKRADLP